MRKLVFALLALVASCGHPAFAQAVINMPNGVYGCDAHTFYDASDNGKKTLVTGVSGKKVYVCGYILGVGGTATNLELGSGTGADCGTTYTKLTPTWQLIANGIVGFMAVYWNSFVAANAGDSLCVNASAGNSHQVELWYTIQ